MKKILLYAWQLPQHLLALLILAVLYLAGRVVKADREALPGRLLFITNTPGWGVSLGFFIFMGKGYGPGDWKHEYGHSVQSERWGPLYLLAIGIPSAIGNNLRDRLFHKSWAWEKRREWYYGRWPENEADRLGGVERN
jgi:hypothetical protein